MSTICQHCAAYVSTTAEKDRGAWCMVCFTALMDLGPIIRLACEKADWTGDDE